MTCAIQPFNRLTPAQAERLALLIEECGEVIHAAAKILRHGYESTHPNGGPGNRQSLTIEIGHLQNAIMMMVNADDLSPSLIVNAQADKARTISRWLHHQDEA